MEVRIQGIHFDVTQQLTDFINKKAARLVRRNPTITYIDANLTVLKAETAMNKQTVIKVIVPHHGELVAKKVADSFEQGVDEAIDAVESQLEKLAAKK
ncbi:MAG: ribosome-associated translation inhibitor RaiA [Bacteroides sp.]|nr:ribosome-associated translation inhibitor RaiA [Bacteroides sp.]MDE5805301.1 ribosome-associated translation inhibitor RaiA [Paramuribaculum sp.]MBD5298312.1 ribosome-associated translation inhibitor RaiA [Bacteroides sp.]MBD5349289.1 ribosome-associated translation inhibitor RaiA [Bacteroides sp.]MBD5422083.1 ribosome-associated translation inhibitor RaiA [Bacteroides sp.]